MLQVLLRPEQPQDPEQVRQRHGVMGKVPAHRRGQVARLCPESLEPLAVARTAQRPVRPLGQRQVVLRVPPRNLGSVRPGRQPLAYELADGLQHPRPRPRPGVVEVNQAVPGQRLRQFQCPVLIQARHPGHGLHCPAIDEHRRDLQQRPLGIFQQSHAPFDRGPKGALPLWQVHGASPECIQ